MSSHFDQNAQPRTDRYISYRKVQKSTESLLKVSSVLLLSQLTATMLPLEADAAGYQAAASATKGSIVAVSCDNNRTDETFRRLSVDFCTLRYEK